MIKFLKRFVFSFNIIAIVLLFAAYASTFISPLDFWPLSFLGLAFPFLILLNIYFMGIWLIQMNRRALYSLIALLIGWQFINQTIQLSSEKKTVTNKQLSAKIISYNAALFGYYQSKWTVSNTIQQIKKLHPDIVCIQEFLNMRSDKSSTIDTIKNACGFKYHYFEKLNDGRKKGEYGLVIFSNYPLKEKGLVHFDQSTGNMCMYADFKLDTNTYRIYNLHLQSFRFKKKDYKFIEKLPADNQEKIAYSKNIVMRMKAAFEKRAQQVNAIKAHMDLLNTPYFITGDFNDPPVSYAYQTLSKNLKDAFVENGSGLGKTYIGAMPNFRIDYILYPKEFEGLEYKSYQLESDHKMVATTIELSH
ncbi:MAG: endonuclease/exonuclease/phosphatase family protein [Bacteroidota bacterium]